eukprot:6954378-Lingulodinium_polyedra.AAC.1
MHVRACGHTWLILPVAHARTAAYLKPPACAVSIHAVVLACCVVGQVRARQTGVATACSMYAR